MRKTVERMTAALLLASGFALIGGANAQVRYEGNFIANTRDPITFDFTVPMFITSFMQFTGEQVNCSAAPRTCDAVIFRRNVSDDFAFRSGDAISIDYDGGQTGSLGIFSNNAFSNYGTYTTLSPFETLTGTLTVSNASPTTTIALPEPATWGMMIFGFGVIGFAMRRRVRASEARFNDRLRRIATGEIA